MVRYFIAVLLAILSLGISNGQSSEEDDPPGLVTFLSEISSSGSLGQARQSFHRAVEKRDTAEILKSGYRLYLRYNTTGNTVKARQILSYLRKIAERKKDLQRIISLMLETGAIEYDLAHYDLALKYFIEARALSARSGNEKAEALALHHIGKYYHSVGNFTESLKYYHQALSIAEVTHDTLIIATVLNYIGNHYLTTGELISGMEACLRSLNLQEKGKLDPIIYGSTCNHLGNIYVELSDFSKAEHYHLLSLHNRQSVSFQEGIGKSYLNLGKLYFLTQRVDSAGLMALKARRIFEETGYTKGKIKCLILSGQVSTVKGAYEDAEHLFNEALQFSEVTGYSKGIVYASYYKGILYLTQNMPDEALSWFTKSLALCRKKGIQEVELDNYLALQKCYTLKSDYPEANKLALQYATAKEKYLISLYNKRLADVQINYESVKSMRIQESLQSENILKEARLKRKNLLILFIIATLLFLFILTVFIYSRYRFKQKDNRILKELNAELQLVNIEKDRFLSIIAHELRNPLWWVKNITETLSQRFDSMNRDQIYTILLTLDDSAKNTFMLMDNLLNWSRSKLNLLPCKPGYFNVEDLMQMNLDQFSVMISQKELTVNAAYLHEGNGFGDKDHYLIIFRNLISNAIKFTPAGGRIEIRTSNRNGYVFVCIQDNGIGIDKEMISRLFDEITSYSTLGLMQEKGAGLGLKLSRDFANKNGGDLRVSCGPEKGTTVEVLIPCNPVPLLQEA